MKTAASHSLSSLSSPSLSLSCHSCAQLTARKDWRKKPAEKPKRLSEDGEPKKGLFAGFGSQKSLKQKEGEEAKATSVPPADDAEAERTYEPEPINPSVIGPNESAAGLMLMPQSSLAHLAATGEVDGDAPFAQVLQTMSRASFVEESKASRLSTRQ